VYVAKSRLARTIYIRCIHGIFGREITKHTVIYGVYIRFGQPYIAKSRLARTIYIRYFGREITKYMVIYGVYI